MKKPGKQRTKPAGKSVGGGGPAVKASAPESRSRRSLLIGLRNGAIGVAVLAAGGWTVAELVAGHFELHDLSAVGNGVPTVVQIHDPQCPQCVRLQNEMLEAAEGFDDAELQVRVANIMTPEGHAMASRHGVSHVTLLLFDAEGSVVRVLRGPNRSETLRAEFTALARGAATPSG